MKKIIILGIAVMGLGLFFALQMTGKGNEKLRMVREEIVLEGGYKGEEGRLTDGIKTFYYSYSFPREVIEDRFSMEDITRDFYREVVDYERDGDNEYLVELQGAERGVVVHRGTEQVSVITVERRDLPGIETALRKNRILEGKLEEKFNLLKEGLVR